MRNQEKESKKLYQMSIHETIEIKGSVPLITITRVIGGWIYTSAIASGSITSVFVPWNNEMQ